MVHGELGVGPLTSLRRLLGHLGHGITCFIPAGYTMMNFFMGFHYLLIANASNDVLLLIIVLCFVGAPCGLRRWGYPLCALFLLWVLPLSMTS